MSHVMVWYGGGNKKMLGPIKAEVIDSHLRFPKVRIVDEAWLKRLGLQSLDVNVHVFTQKRVPPDEAYAWYKLVDESWLKSMESHAK